MNEKINKITYTTAIEDFVKIDNIKICIWRQEYPEIR